MVALQKMTIPLTAVVCFFGAMPLCMAQTNQDAGAASSMATTSPSTATPPASQPPSAPSAAAGSTSPSVAPSLPAQQPYQGVGTATSTQPNSATASVWVAWIAAAAAVLSAIIAGVFAWRTKGIEREVKQIEVAGQAGKELLLADLSAQADGLLHIRVALYEAKRAGSRWVLALYEGRKDKPVLDETFRLMEALIVAISRAPAAHRAGLEAEANNLMGALHWLVEDAREDHDYHQDGELCSNAEQKLFDLANKFEGKLDAWEKEHLAQREHMYKVLQEASRSQSK